MISFYLMLNKQIKITYPYEHPLHIENRVTSLTETSIEEYEKKLDKLVEKNEIKCPKCGNDEDFMVNELGHIFCNKCYSKIPNIRL